MENERGNAGTRRLASSSMGAKFTLLTCNSKPFSLLPGGPPSRRRRLTYHENFIYKLKTLGLKLHFRKNPSGCLGVKHATNSTSMHEHNLCSHP